MSLFVKQCLLSFLIPWCLWQYPASRPMSGLTPAHLRPLKSVDNEWMDELVSLADIKFRAQNKIKQGVDE